MSLEQLIFKFPLNPDFQMKNFVVCSENELAYKASIRITEHPEKADLNPLFIIGGEGTGKTHLLHAIANRISARYPAYKTIIISTLDFINKYSKVRYFAETCRLSPEYKELDFLLIDDIHLIEIRDNLQEQFFHIYNELISRGKRVVISSARSPQHMKGLNGYLRSRLLSGAFVTIKSSGDSIRISILKKMARDIYLTLSDSSAKFITNHYTRDIKEFEKILQKIDAYSLSVNKKVTATLIREALGNLKLEACQVSNFTTKPA